MDRLASTTLRLCLLLLVFTGTKWQQSQCEDGWFGDKCQYQCHCLYGTTCDKTNGDCSSGCDKRWFGPQCQYRDAAFSNNKIALTDGDDSTCLVGPDLTQIVPLLEDVMFTWMRIVTNKPGLFGLVNMTFLSSYGLEVASKSPLRNIYVSDTILELYGEFQDRIKSIKLDFDTQVTRESFCTMQVSSGRNVAIKQKASQSSTWENGFAENAVDGKPYQQWHEGSCTHTDNDDSLYWTLNLSLPVTVNMYKLLGRKESNGICRLNYFRLESYSHSTKVQEYDETNKVNQLSYDVYLVNTSPITSVTLSVSEYSWPNDKYICNNNIPALSFCEMQIFGDVVCPQGKWGRDCEKDCNCQDPSESCFVSTGMCPSGCKAGFHGSGCREECAGGQWGISCLNRCGKCLNGKCNTISGECPSGCVQGYKMPFCVQECDFGFHGYNCIYSCPENCRNKTCNKVDGFCIECEAGYQGPLCSQVCDATYYGENCATPCSDMCIDQLCHHITGVCEKCPHGKQMSKDCSEDCDTGFHGYNCIQSCPVNCRGNICDNVDGTCTKCVAGHQGLVCNQDCYATFYGEDCATQCSDKCIDQLCHHITGVCDNCPDGKQISKDCSQDCSDGFFGPRCANQCSEYCWGDGFCNNINGRCLSGCKPGYTSDNCEQTCAHTTYGEGCNKTCSLNCVVNATQEPAICEHVNGQCLLGCVSGYSGNTCEEITSDDINPVIIVVPIILVLMAIAALITGVCLWRRRKAQQTDGSPVVNTGKEIGPDVAHERGVRLEMKNQQSREQDTVNQNYENMSPYEIEEDPGLNIYDKISPSMKRKDNQPFNEFEKTGVNRDSTSNVYKEPEKDD